MMPSVSIVHFLTFASMYFLLRGLMLVGTVWLSGRKEESPMAKALAVFS